jgi:hypothetical protein
MGAHKVQRSLAALVLYALTAFWLVFWLLGWFVFENQAVAEQGFYMSGTFVAATLVYMGIRASIYE